MFDLSQLFHSVRWPLLILAVLLAIAVIAIAIWEALRNRVPDLSVYVKRPFLFDTKTESELFNILQELYNDKYYIFPQVAYSHVLTTRKGLDEKERFVAWNRINRKSADFVLCDKVQVIPRLVIELDGSSHDMPDRIERDGFINNLMNIANLPILHIKTDNMGKEFVKLEVNRAVDSFGG